MTPDLQLVPTKDGFRFTFGGKNYLVTKEQLHREGDFLAAVGFQMMLAGLAESQPDPKRAILYHNTEEAGVTWPERRRK